MEMLTTTVRETGKILFKDKGENSRTGTEGQQGSLPPGILASVTISVTSSQEKNVHHPHHHPADREPNRPVY